jgi:hypothetical protein
VRIAYVKLTIVDVSDSVKLVDDSEAASNVVAESVPVVGVRDSL